MKNFSNEYINNWDTLYKAIVGFEFEFYSKWSYYKLLELLNKELFPIKTWGFRKYHSDFKPDENNFKIEPDLSGGLNLVELITGPLPYTNCKVILLKILKFIQKNGYTNEKCSIHINISFDKDKSEKVLPDLNKLRLILDVNEEYIYKLFPERENNYYAKSVKSIIPFKNYNYANDAVNILLTNLTLPDSTKYYGINIANYTAGRLEYRYIGGKDYEYKTDSILKLLDYFILLTYNNLDREIEQENIDKLFDYLNDNINMFKNFTKFENFIAEFPTISLEVDKKTDYILINSYYDNIYDKLYDLIRNSKDLINCTINYDTERRRFEVVDANVLGIYQIDGIDFINCNITNGFFNNCNFIDSEVKNSHIEKSNILSEVFNCKLTDCKVEYGSVLRNCYFYGGILNGIMKSGVFRSGKVGENGVIESEVSIVNDELNYFNTKKSENDKKGKEDVKNYNSKNILKF